MSNINATSRRRFWGAFSAGLLLGSVVASICVIVVAENRFASRSPVVVLYELAQLSTFPGSDLAIGLRNTVKSRDLTRQFGLDCEATKKPRDPRSYTFSCQQDDLFGFLPTIGKPRITIKLCEGSVCDYGFYRI